MIATGSIACRAGVFGPLGLLVLLAAGCESPPEPSYCDPGASVRPPAEANAELDLVDVGGGLEPIGEGSEARLVRGSQGGYMLVLDVELRGGPPGEQVCGRLRLDAQGLEDLGEAAYLGPTEEGVSVRFDGEGMGRIPSFPWQLGWDEAPLRGRTVAVVARFEAEGLLAERRIEGVRLLGSSP